MARKIIAFSGRMGSGKTELAMICEKYGYERIYFAKPLKMLVAKLIGVDESEINSLKNIEKEYILTDSDNRMVSKETDIPYDVVKSVLSQEVFTSVRRLLQVIGTNLIRSYNANWHVNKIRSMLGDEKSYVFDDVRFPNELKLIEELGGDAWFVVRPTIDNVSNHISETSLFWQDFGDKIIINDGSLNLFKTKWDIFMSDYEKSLEKREKFIDDGYELCKIYSEVKEPLGVMDVLELSKYYFTYVERRYHKDVVKDIKKDDKLGVVVTFIDDKFEIVNNPLNIEDLKTLL